MLGLEPLHALLVVCVLALLTSIVAFVTVGYFQSSAYTEWKKHRLTGGIAVFAALFPLFTTAYFKMYEPIASVPTKEINGSWGAYHFGPTSFFGIWTFTKTAKGTYDLTVTMDPISPATGPRSFTRTFTGVNFDGKALSFPPNSSLQGSFNTTIGFVGTFSDDASAPAESADKINTGTLIGYEPRPPEESITGILYSIIPIVVLILFGLVLTVLLFRLISSEAVVIDRKTRLVGAAAGFFVIWSMLSSGYFLFFGPHLKLRPNDIKGLWTVENTGETDKYAEWKFSQAVSQISISGNVFVRQPDGNIAPLASFPPVEKVEFDGKNLSFNYKSRFGNGRCDIHFRRVLIGKVLSCPWNDGKPEFQTDSIILFRGQ